MERTLEFYTPPTEGQGEVVTASFAYDADRKLAIKRVYSRITNSTRYFSARLAEGEDPLTVGIHRTPEIQGDWTEEKMRSRME